MMKVLRSFIVLVMLACIMGMGSTQYFAKMTVKVINEEGDPVKDADVTIVFTSSKTAGKGWGTTSEKKVGKSDKDGLFSASGKHNEPRVFGSAQMEGWYSSTDGFDVKNLIDNKWHPWNPTITIILKKKRNPVPMFVKRTDWINIPSFKQPIGYDLQTGDWVAPHGKGKINDFIFNFSTKAHEISYTLSFANNNDGIQEYEHKTNDNSSYKWPFEAPEIGYQSYLFRELKYIDRKMKTNLKKKVNYIYRVRTVTDEKGQIIKACYGKIPSEIDVATNGKVKFSYYFNPDGARNLEFDTEKNLFIPEGAKKYKSKYDKFTGFSP